MVYFLFVSFNSRQAAIAEKSKWAFFDKSCNKLFAKVFFLSRKVVCRERERTCLHVSVHLLILRWICPCTKGRQGEWPFSDLTFMYIAANTTTVMGYVDFSSLNSCSHYQLAFSKNELYCWDLSCMFSAKKSLCFQKWRKSLC